jgi:DNA-binding transcriptional regulator LsrR (DeoR family)
MSNAELAHVARLHYLRGLSKQEVAARLGISRFRVARLLAAARAAGVVRIEIRGEVDQADEAAAALERSFGLQHAVVARAAEDVPALAAAWLPQLLAPDAVVGIAWGATLRATVRALPPLDLGAPVVQICGAVPGLDSGTGPSEVGFQLAERLGGSFHALPAPAVAGAAAYEELLENEAVRPTVALFSKVTVALVGIGARPPYAPAAASGHVLVHAFDVEGRVLPTNVHAIALSLERLRETRVVGVAAGREKRRAVLGALRSGLVDVLVTDEHVARYAVERAVRSSSQAPC